MTTSQRSDRAVAYGLAQRAIADLKHAIYLVLLEAPDEGLQNAQIGRTLGIYGGHAGHDGHIPRTLLEMLQREDVVAQDVKTKRWSLRQHLDDTALSGSERS